jgi:hypothetical protein
LRISFNPQRSWASLFRAFFLSEDRESLSGFFLRSCVYVPNRIDLVRTLQRFHPLREAASFIHPKRLIRDGMPCSPELSDLSGYSLRGARRKASPFSSCPLVLRSRLPHGLRATLNPRGFNASGLAFSLLQGTPTCMAFPAHCQPPSFREDIRCGLFFHLREFGVLTNSSLPIFAANGLPPNGR